MHTYKKLSTIAVTITYRPQMFNCNSSCQHCGGGNGGKNCGSGGSGCAGGSCGSGCGGNNCGSGCGKGR